MENTTLNTALHLIETFAVSYTVFAMYSLNKKELYLNLREERKQLLQDTENILHEIFGEGTENYMSRRQNNFPKANGELMRLKCRAERCLEKKDRTIFFNKIIEPIVTCLKKYQKKNVNKIQDGNNDLPNNTVMYGFLDELGEKYLYIENILFFSSFKRCTRRLYKLLPRFFFFFINPIQF